jgi:hypothetical protein
MNDEYDLLLFKKDYLERQKKRLLAQIADDNAELLRINHELDMLRSQELEESLLNVEPKASAC